VQRVVKYYAEGAANEPIAYVGSQGLVEIAMQKASAARALEARRGMEVDLVVPA
jgi:S-adenosylmethionine hydrolase